MTQNSTTTADLQHITTDECVDFAGGLLDSAERRRILLHTASCAECEQTLKAVMAHAELSRAAAYGRDRSSEPIPGAARGRQGASWLETVRGWFSVPLSIAGQKIPIPVTAAVLAVGILIGVGSIQVFEPSANRPAGSTAQLLSLYPSANRTVGLPTVDSQAFHLYLELNEIGVSGTDTVPFVFSGPDGSMLLSGQLMRNRDTGEWTGLYMPGELLSESGRYVLSLKPVGDDTVDRCYSFIIADRS